MVARILRMDPAVASCRSSLEAAILAPQRCANPAASFRWKALLGLVCAIGGCVFGTVLATPAIAATTGEPKGLYVRDGVLTRAGKPYHGIGANYLTLFGRIVKDADDRSSLVNLENLARAGIPFVRFNIGGHWPVDQKLYLEDRPEFFRRLDLVVHTAEENEIGLIPSFFWFYATVADLAGEPRDQFGNPNSKANNFIRTYTEEVVMRYRDSPAIWGWEFGNEANLTVDLPNAPEHRPRVAPRFGTPTERTERDDLSFEQLRTAYVVFAETVRKFDQTRIIDTGNALPRGSAWHNANGKSWTADTPAQFKAMLLRQTPDPMNVISVHVYSNPRRRYPGGTNGIDEIVARATRLAAEAHKPLFLGEFPVTHREQAEEFLQAIEKNRVPLSAFWVFDYNLQEKSMSVNFDNERSFVIERVAEANRRLAAGSLPDAGKDR